MSYDHKSQFDISSIRDDFIRYVRSRGWFLREHGEGGIEYVYAKPKILLGAGYIFTSFADENALDLARSVRWNAGAAFIVCEEAEDSMMNGLDKNVGIYCLSKRSRAYNPAPSYELEKFLREKYGISFTNTNHGNL